VRVQGKDPISGAYANINAAPTAVTATGMNLYVLYPGATAGGTQAFNTILPRTFRYSVAHGDSSSYTYSLGYCLIN
jgi:hypothetical protein